MKNQIVKINENWQVVRVNPLNWQIQELVEAEKRDGTKTMEWTTGGNFFGSLIGAINALPSKMLDREANASLQAVKASHDEIKAIIKSALEGNK